MADTEKADDARRRSLEIVNTLKEQFSTLTPSLTGDVEPATLFLVQPEPRETRE
ncbi:MAG: hypothetical protein JOY54_14240 [Acidobacteriaceae bacterium]|nr:hypothetical protein [Acidobacteriaceae bacterium]